MRFARATPWLFIGANAAAVAAVVVAALFFVPPQGPWGGGPAYYTLNIVGFLGVAWVVLLVRFFRDPGRPVGEGVVSPADGRVRAASADGARVAISVVLGVFDVHVIRAPAPGRLVSAAHRKGAKRLASSKEADENERLVMEFAGAGEAEGATVRLTLIAGAFADRIVNYLGEGQAVQKGERVGMIKFGSRVDVEYVGGPDLRLCVEPGATVKAGQTPILLPARGGGAP